jgi:4-phospho-D-threonate 3-dehydrogenase / 4-phospho-D-erythronate 3-dehydrogenase
MRGKPDKPIVAITVGDYNGIGPEVVIKSLLNPGVWKVCNPLLVGPHAVFAYYARKYRLAFSGVPGFDVQPDRPGHGIQVIETATMDGKGPTPGRVSAAAGRTAANAIEEAVRLVREEKAEAMVTAPVSKKALHLAGVNFPGQTEMVQKLSGSKQVAMMLVSKTMRVGLVTIHIPLKAVSHTLTRPLLREKVRIVHAALQQDWKIRAPRIAILGLNPHAGEDGDIGSEDKRIILPVVHEFRRRKLRIEGPFPADAFFGTYEPGNYDAVLAMYHDQGLIPLKMTSFGCGVNISVGLNIIRTSPDHGTAFDIAGRGVADPGSMIEAMTLAALVATNRRVFRKKRE